MPAEARGLGSNTQAGARFSRQQDEIGKKGNKKNGENNLCICVHMCACVCMYVHVHARVRMYLNLMSLSNVLNPKPCTLNPKPQTRTRSPKLETPICAHVCACT